MGLIPNQLYEELESKIRTRWTILSDARMELEKARAKAYDTSAPIGGGGGGKSSGHSSRTERAAMNLMKAEKKFALAVKWDGVFQQIDRVFPDDTSVGFTASLLYGNGMSQEDVCRATGASRQTVRRCRDKYIINVAIIAAGKGLIEVEEIGQDDPEDRDPHEN